MQAITPARAKNNTRRTVLMGIGILSLFSFLTGGFFPRKKNILSCAPSPEEEKTLKFLTQEGMLVEVAISKVNTLKEKASDKELRDWVKRPSPLNSVDENH